MYFLKKFYKQADALDVKAYVPTVAIVKDVNKICFFNGDTSKEYIFDEDGDFINVEEKKNWVVCTYNVTSTTSSIKMPGSYYVASMEVDGEETTADYYYTFSTTGHHVVKFVMKDETNLRGFNDNKNLISVTIPDSVTAIGVQSFNNCTSLVSVTIPDSVTTIGMDAFEECTALASITIPDSVTNIGEGAFEECTALASIIIPDSVTNIGKGAFR